MKLTAVLVLLFASVAFSGCDSLSDAGASVREHFADRNKPRTETFAGTPRVVFGAVREAARHLGFRQTYGGPAERRFDGIGGVDSGGVASARQVGIKVRLSSTLDGKSTDVAVRFTEYLEADSSNQMGMATETTMQDTPLYGVFFRLVRQGLPATPAAPKTQPARAGE